MEDKLRTGNPKLRVEFVRTKPKGSVGRFIRRKAESIFRRYPRLEGLRINVKREKQGSKSPRYIAQTRLILPGHDRIVEKRATAAFAAISEALEVADRQLRKQAGILQGRPRNAAA